MDRRFEAIDERLDAIDRRLDGIDARLRGIDKPLEDMRQNIDAREERVRNVFDVKGDRILDLVGKMTEGFTATIERLERSVDDSQHQTREMLAAQKRVLKDRTRRLSTPDRGQKKRCEVPSTAKSRGPACKCGTEVAGGDGGNRRGRR